MMIEVLKAEIKKNIKESQGGVKQLKKIIIIVQDMQMQIQIIKKTKSEDIL